MNSSFLDRQLADRAKVARVMKKVRLNPACLAGPRRRATSRHALPTMRGKLSDPIAYFAKALRTELEHGRAGGPATNVTNNTLHKTAKIALAHLRGVEYGEAEGVWARFPAYYDYLWWMEKHGPVKTGSACKSDQSPSPSW